MCTPGRAYTRTYGCTEMRGGGRVRGGGCILQGGLILGRTAALKWWGGGKGRRMCTPGRAYTRTYGCTEMRGGEGKGRRVYTPGWAYTWTYGYTEMGGGGGKGRRVYTSGWAYTWTYGWTEMKDVLIWNILFSASKSLQPATLRDNQLFLWGKKWTHLIHVSCRCSFIDVWNRTTPNPTTHADARTHTCS